MPRNYRSSLGRRMLCCVCCVRGWNSLSPPSPSFPNTLHCPLLPPHSLSLCIEEKRKKETHFILYTKQKIHTLPTRARVNRWIRRFFFLFLWGRKDYIFKSESNQNIWKTIKQTKQDKENDVVVFEKHAETKIFFLYIGSFKYY